MTRDEGKQTGVTVVEGATVNGRDEDDGVDALCEIPPVGDCDGDDDARFRTVSLSEHLSRSVLADLWSCREPSAERRSNAASALERHLLSSAGLSPETGEQSEEEGRSQQEESSSFPPPRERPTMQGVEADAYLTLFGPCQGHLPALDWNHHFRKAYTLMMWIRPRLTETDPLEGMSQGGGDGEGDRERQGGEGERMELEPERVFYRLSTCAEDTRAIGVAVTCSKWKVVVPDGGPRRVQTLLTAYSLPKLDVDPAGGGAQRRGSGAYSSYVESRLTLEEDAWHLVGFCQQHPYLKRPLWTVTVNGAVQGQGYLDYPVVSGDQSQEVFGIGSNRSGTAPQSSPSMSMDYNILLSNVVMDGAVMPTATGSDGGRGGGDSPEELSCRHVGLRLDCSSFSLYPEQVSPNLQAVASEAGPAMSLQKSGRALPTLPPVANWSKGSSLEGPKVGIPLVVHSAALELQKTAGKCIFAISALSARVLGVAGTGALLRQQRILCPLELQAGSTESTPRVGLIQPASAVRIPDEDMPVFYLSGHVRVHHALSDFLLRAEGADRLDLDSSGGGTTRNLSVALQEQGLLSAVVLPFFLGLCPTGHLYGLQGEHYLRSARHLFALYSSDGELAARLIRLLTAFIRAGGGRAHEEVLQAGILHVLATTLRLSLIRANRTGMFEPSAPKDFREFLERCRKVDSVDDDGDDNASNSDDAISPAFIPEGVVRACVDLVDACCGPAGDSMEHLPPFHQVRRTSDLALTAVFGFALDWDLWTCSGSRGGDDLERHPRSSPDPSVDSCSDDCGCPRRTSAACRMFEAVARRYGGPCVVYGYILRSQVSVQYFLDTVRLSFSSVATTSPWCICLERSAVHLSSMLQAMLLSSLSNRRSISQGEHDISACCSALADCPLGSFTAHVVLNALMTVLTWCEILPVEAVFDDERQAQEQQVCQDEELKMQIASRLGRNLLMSQFHDVVAPMLLSRTVFSGEQSIAVAQQHNRQAKVSETRADSTGVPPSSSSSSSTWQRHWQLSLLLFSWVASIAGKDGLSASQSVGSLLLAAGLAGSVPSTALESASKVLVTALFLPPPAMALMIGSALRSEWSYTDLLSDRISIMISLLPGMVVSLLSQHRQEQQQDDSPISSSGETSDVAVSSQCMTVLSEILTAIGGAFHRVYGGTIHSTEGTRRQLKNIRDQTSTHIKATRQYVPHLLAVGVVFERYILSMASTSSNAEVDSNPRTVGVLSPPATSPRQHEAYRERLRTDSSDFSSSQNAAWVEVQKPSSTASESLIDEVVVQLPSPATAATAIAESGTVPQERVWMQGPSLLRMLRSCQKSVLNTTAGLISNAMNLGGAGASLSVWQTVLGALQEAVGYLSTGGGDGNDVDDTNAKEAMSAPAPNSNNDGQSASAGLSVLCRLTALALFKALKRCSHFEVWSYELSSAVSKLVLLVEEKELLKVPARIVTIKGGEGRHRRAYSEEQVILVSVLVDLLAYGRESTGWCQLSLPTMEMSDSNPNSKRAAGNDLSATSRLLLPVLQPGFRILMETVEHIDSTTLVEFPCAQAVSVSQSGSKSTDSGDRDFSMTTETLLGRVVSELDSTLTAAIVGLSFSSARDMALHAAATLRKATERHVMCNDPAAPGQCIALLCKVVEELRVRYEGERRLRDTALFDAYEKADANDTQQQDAARQAAADTQAIERLILGGDLLGAASDSNDNKEEEEDRLKDPPSSSELIVFSDTGDQQEQQQQQELDHHHQHVAHSSPVPPPRPTLQTRVSEDFVVFHEPGATDKKDKKKGSITKLGYAQYEGLGAALQECKGFVPNDDSVGQNEELSDKAARVLSILAPFLDAWDATVAQDAAESELIQLFDTTLQAGSEKKMAVNQDKPLQLGSESAADAMSTFFEFAAAEKSRLKEISARFLPSHRYSRVSYTHRFCWARYMELTAVGSSSCQEMWERGVADGNRDIRSRLLTVPCAPQFRRYIPKYLDHNADLASSSPTKTASPEKTENDKGKEEMEDQVQMDADTFTKTLLETTNLEIVDITKREVLTDEDEDEGEGGGVSLNQTADNELLFDDEGVGHMVEGEDTKSDIKHEESSMTTAASTEDRTMASTAGSVPAADDADAEAEAVFAKGSIAAAAAAAAQHQHHHHSITSSAFATPPDNASSSLSLMHSAAAGQIEQHLDNCLHVKAEGSRTCTMLLTSTHLILEYDCHHASTGNSQNHPPDGFYEGEMLALQEEAERQRMIQDVGGSISNQGCEDDEQRRGMEAAYQHAVERRQLETAGLRPKSIRWNLSEVSHIFLRRYRLRDSSIELFFLPSGGTSFGGYGLFSPAASLFLDFGPGYEGVARRDEAAVSIMKRAPPQALKQWPDRSAQFLHDQLSRITMGWVEGRISNFDYLLHLNMLSGRSYNDICQYPVFPWVLADYDSEQVPDLEDRNNFRDLTKPVGALNPERLDDFMERFKTFSDPCIPPFMYGSHYSTSAGVVLHFLVRLHPFAGLHRQLQGGHFDVADRLFSSVPRTWGMCTGSSAAEVKELTPEWYCNPAFLKNTNSFKLGTSQDGELLGDVSLPPWADGSPEKFVEVMRAALESNVCSSMLPDWIDLIFGRKQQGPEAIAAKNVFFYLTYYGSVDVASIKDEGLRQATELQIAHFGQCPMQLFKRPHVRRLPIYAHKLSFYQVLSPFHSQRRQQQELETITRSSKDATDVEDPTALSATATRKGATATYRRTATTFGEPVYLPFFNAPLSHWVHLNAPPPGPHSPLVAVRLAGTDRVLAVDAKGIFHCFRWAWRPEERQVDRNPNGMDASKSDKSHFDPGCFIAQRELPRFRSVPRLMHTPAGPGEVPAVAISKTLFAGRAVLLVLSDGDGIGSLGMQLVDPSKGSIRGEVVIPAIHSGRITCIATDPIGTAAGHGGVGGELALVGSSDGNASLWRFMSSHYLPLRPRVRMQGAHGGSKICATALCSSIHVGATVSKQSCCLFSIGNGTVIRNFRPPADALDLMSEDNADAFEGTCIRTRTYFADTPALAVSVQGFVVTVCETVIEAAGCDNSSSDCTSTASRTVVTLNLFTIEGVNLGCKPLEAWRGLPRKMHCTPDGTAVLVCCGRGVTIHRLSACQPLEFLDEWQITESEEPFSNTAATANIMTAGISKSSAGDGAPAAWDVDLGPSLNRPVLAAAACTSGVLRLHALQGISAWSERHKKSNITQSVSSALAKPARHINRAVREGWGLGRQLAGMGRDIGREVTSGLGQVVFRKKAKGVQANSASGDGNNPGSAI